LSCAFFVLTEHHAMKAYWRNGSIAPRVLDLGIRWRWVVSFTARPLYLQAKSPWYPFDRKLGGSQNRSERSCEEKNSELLPGLEPPFIQAIAQRYINEISRLHSLFRTSIYLNPCSRVIPEKLIVIQIDKKFPAFINTQGSVSCSQQPVTGPYPDPDRSIKSYKESRKLRYVTLRYSETYPQLTVRFQF
jgi:hypothetical protein